MFLQLCRQHWISPAEPVQVCKSSLEYAKLSLCVNDDCPEPCWFSGNCDIDEVQENAITEPDFESCATDIRRDVLCGALSGLLPYFPVPVRQTVSGIFPGGNP